VSSNFTKKLISLSNFDTSSLARNFAESLGVGSNVFLVGDLGSGKTVFTKSLLEFFGIKKGNSPSFKLINEYNIFLNLQKIKFYHVDLYRLEDIDEILELGIDEIIDSDSISVIEWADRAYFLWKNKKFNNSYRIDIDYDYSDIKQNEVFDIDKVNFQKRLITIRKL